MSVYRPNVYSSKRIDSKGKVLSGSVRGRRSCLDVRLSK